MSQTPLEGRWTLLRLVCLMVCLAVYDVVFLIYTSKGVLQQGLNMLLLFAFEYLILASTLVCVAIKFGLTVYDLHLQGRWENKSVCIMYLEFVTDIFQLLVYLCFFLTILLTIGVPLHVIRQMYNTAVSLNKRIMDVVRYRRATARMDQQYESNPTLHRSFFFISYAYTDFHSPHIQRLNHLFTGFPMQHWKRFDEQMAFVLCAERKCSTETKLMRVQFILVLYASVCLVDTLCICDACVGG
jgi:hypothetical protein